MLSHPMHHVGRGSLLHGVGGRTELLGLQNDKITEIDSSKSRAHARDLGGSTVYRVYHTPRAGFQARLLMQEGANTERYVFGKLSPRCSQRRPLWHRQYSDCGDIDHGQSAQGGVIYTVVYGRCGTLTDSSCSAGKLYRR